MYSLCRHIKTLLKPHSKTFWNIKIFLTSFWRRFINKGVTYILSILLLWLQFLRQDLSLSSGWNREERKTISPKIYVFFWPETMDSFQNIRYSKGVIVLKKDFKILSMWVNGSVLPWYNHALIVLKIYRRWHISNHRIKPSLGISHKHTEVFNMYMPFKWENIIAIIFHVSVL